MNKRDLVPEVKDDFVSSLWAKKSENMFAQPALTDERRGTSIMREALVRYDTFSYFAHASMPRSKSVKNKSEFMSCCRPLDAIFYSLDVYWSKGELTADFLILRVSAILPGEQTGTRAQAFHIDVL